jgi:parallel beta-helix repeat protein
MAYAKNTLTWTVFESRATVKSARPLAPCLVLLAWVAATADAKLHVPSVPCPTIQAAIDAAKPNDEIEVARGTYYETINFKGKALWLHSRDGAAVTTIAGSSIGGPFTVYCRSNEASATILEGFTITRGGIFGGVGGGMYNRDSSPTVTDCTFTFTEIAMWNEGSNPTVTKCTFSDNLESMANFGSNPTVIGCTFSDNNAMWGGVAGMHNRNGSPTVINCQFINNFSANGGAMWNEASSPTIINCTFTGNTTSFFGGAMDNSDSNPTLINCAFIGNQASWGGGIASDGGSPTLINCTFTGNTAWFEEGGGIANYGGGLTLSNCILWSDSGGEIYNSGDAAVSYSDIAGGFPGEGNIDADPLLDADCHLQPGSPCIDAGNSADVPDEVRIDLDGKPRIRGASVDVGAYESWYRGRKANY